MSLGPMAAALTPLRARLGGFVSEREVLRVAATITAAKQGAAVEQARNAALSWAKRRCGGNLPGQAWRGESFEYLAAGRTTLGTRLAAEDVELWALRGDDPDKSIARRVWTTEVTIGQSTDEAPHLSLRLLVSTPEEEPEFEPAVPGLLRQIASQPGLAAGGFALSDKPWSIGSGTDLDKLVAMLEAPGRSLPVFVASGDERAEDPTLPLIDVGTLARVTIGLAHVVVVPARFTYGLSDTFGKLRSCYHGAVRVYMPGFDSAADPYVHPLTLGERVQRDPGAVIIGLRRLAAKESLRRLRLGKDVLTFASVRTAALQIEQGANASLGGSEAERLKVAEERIKALEDERDAKQAEATQNFDLAHEEGKRAQIAESQLHHARERVRQLEAQLTSKGQQPDEGVTPPASWAELADWCDQFLVGKLALAPAARKGIRKPAFEDFDLVVRCLRWLAYDYRDRRINGGGLLANISVGPGLENAPCGADAFRFDFQGRRLDADSHIKNGGNTRSPERCLRIYYAWDEHTQQIVVADMPAHRRTGAS